MHGVEYNRWKVCMGWDRIGGWHAWGGIEQGEGVHGLG